MPHRLSPRPSGLVAAVLVAASAAAAGLVGVAGAAHAATTVDLATGSAFLAGQLSPSSRPAYSYDSSLGFTDFGLTMDVGLALAASGQQRQTLADLVDFLENGHDPSGATLNSNYLSIGQTEYESGGSIGKAMLLEQVVGHDPTDVGPEHLDLATALAGTVCRKAITNVCAAAGNYRNTPSVFGQSLGIIAQVRGGQSATKPVAYLVSQQQADGSFPSQLPTSAGDEDVDSTAMAAMALDLVPGHTAVVDKALAWMAGRQLADGGFPGAAGNSTNSAGLAVQGLSLRPGTYDAAVGRARGFLAAHQQADGGFPVNATGTTTDLRASAQALGGSTGASFGTLRIVGTLPGAGSTPPSTPPTSTPPSSPPPSTPVSTRPTTPASSSSSSGSGTSGSGTSGAGTSGGGSLSTSGAGTGGSAARGGGIVDSRSGSSSPSSSTSSSTSTTSPSTTTPTPTSTSTSSPVAAGSTTPPVRDLAASPTSGPLAKVNPLWWAVLALAVAFGGALVLTLRRRPAGAHEGGAHR